uniref:ER lumen protein-retaining receptor 2-like n=1 Tax=Diabrotica virgifera virgifera TaxID=50390 RepID=A0A6P7F844_DIAVI
MIPACLYGLLIFFSSFAFFLSFRMKETYEKKYDSFWTEILLIPLLILAVFVNYDHSPFGILNAFSDYLESVALVPQLYMIWNKTKITKHIKIYLYYMYAYICLKMLYWFHVYYVYGTFNIISQVALAVEFIILSVSIVTLHCKSMMRTSYEVKVTKSQNIFLVNSGLLSLTTAKADEVPLITDEVTLVNEEAEKLTIIRGH